MIYKIKKEQDVIFVDQNCAMVTAKFVMDGKIVEPLYTHPWDEGEVDSGILKYLKGDFFCVPFGITPSEEVDGYVPQRKLDAIEYPHGLSSNAPWDAEGQNDEYIELEIKYDNHPYIDKLNRKICFMKEKQGILLENKVYVDKDFKTTIGCHPIFKLNEKPYSMKLIVPECKFLATYPKKCEETSITKQREFFNDLKRVPLVDGSNADFSMLPLKDNTEEIIMLCGVENGLVKLENLQEGYRVVLEFDNEVFGSLLLWFSNKGRKYEPWNKRNLCLGIEPITAPFDFGHDIAVGENELSKKGIETCYRFKKDETLKVDYHIYVEKL